MMNITISEQETGRCGRDNTLIVCPMMHTAAVIFYTLGETAEMSVSHINSYTDINMLFKRELKRYQDARIKPYYFLLINQASESQWEAGINNTVSQNRSYLRYQQTRKATSHYVSLMLSTQSLTTQSLSESQFLMQRKLFSVSSQASSVLDDHYRLTMMQSQIQLFLTQLNGTCKLIRENAGEKQSLTRVVFDHTPILQPVRLETDAAKITNKLEPDLVNLSHRVNKHTSKNVVFQGDKHSLGKGVVKEFRDAMRCATHHMGAQEMRPN